MRSDAILSPPDSRDYTAGAALEMSGAALPPDFEVWQPEKIENQTAGNCVAQTLANIMECIAHRMLMARLDEAITANDEEAIHSLMLALSNIKDYSVGYIYGTPLSTVQGPGMEPREALKSLRREGDVLREVWECDDENPLCREKRAQLPPEIHSLARRIKAFVRLNTKEEMQRYMLKYKLPVLIVAPTSAFGWGSGYHAVACYGWVSRETCERDYSYMEYRDLRYTNSWGAWNPRGLVQYEQITEMWGVIPMDDIKLVDIDGHWAQQFIKRAQELGLVNGYEDNTFRPDSQITRAETAKLVTTLADQLLDEYSKLDTRVRRMEKMFGLQPID